MKVSDPLHPPTELGGGAERRRQAARLTLLLALCVVASFLLQLPTDGAADWKQFSFYDPGTTLKGDLLISRGYVPSVDFGYTHGLLSLVFGRGVFGVFGRGPWTFLWANLGLELVMAWGLGRILASIRANGAAILVFALAVPIAIQPAYLTLTHPLEAAVLICALAEQMEGRRGRALALVTACAFIKPSMAYVYGLILVVMILWGRRHVVRQLLPAAVTGAALFAGLAVYFGVRAVVNTLLPLTGARTYAATGFGFFSESGREFWSPPVFRNYFITPVVIYLLMAILAAAGVVVLGVFLARRMRRPVPGALALLAMAGLLNSAFLLGFYGWSGSWMYYAYLPVLGLACWFTMLRSFPRTQVIAAALVVPLIVISQGVNVVMASKSWQMKVRTPETAGLWAWQPNLDEWAEIRTVVQEWGETPRVVVMSNGYVPVLPEGYEMIDAWFPERGIPTASEAGRIRKQVEDADFVVLYDYREFENAWWLPEIEGLHGEFEEVYTGWKLTLMRRRN